MKSLSLPSLETLDTSLAGDIFSNKTEGIFKLFSFVDVETLSVNSSNNPAFNISSTNINFTNGDFYLNGVEFSGHSRISIGGSSKFKKIISNQITASFDVNSTNNNMFEGGDGTAFTKGTGQFLVNSSAGPSKINNTGYIDRTDWSSNPGSSKEFQISNYQSDIFFDLQYNTGNTAALSNPYNNEIVIKLPENYTDGNVFSVTFRFDSRKNYKPASPFGIKFQKQGTNDIQIISQYFGNEVNNYSITTEDINITNLDTHTSFNLLYLGNNFFNIDLNSAPFAGASSYEEKSIVMNNSYNQWMLIEI